MVPSNVEKMNAFTFQSLTKLNTDLYEPNGKISHIKNDINLDKDNFFNASVQVEKKQTVFLPMDQG